MGITETANASTPNKTYKYCNVFVIFVWHFAIHEIVAKDSSPTSNYHFVQINLDRLHLKHILYKTPFNMKLKSIYFSEAIY